MKNQKTFLTEKFSLGLKTGNKEHPEKVAREMRVVKHPKGQRKFGIEEFLTLQLILQIFSLYSRKNDFIREHTISKLEQNLLK